MSEEAQFAVWSQTLIGTATLIGSMCAILGGYAAGIFLANAEASWKRTLAVPIGIVVMLAGIFLLFHGVDHFHKASIIRYLGYNPGF